MPTIGTLISFNEFIKTHNVEIPRIQRDYTYGSGTPKTEVVVDKLLSDIHSALLDPNNELILDFVYGSQNEKSNFEPLDGQQRLTTLFLLQLYAAWGSNINPSSLDFRYSTRDNTSEFCESITNPDKFKYDKDGPIISDQITDCAFWRSSFNDDPSIRSMLTVLDKIESRFKNLSTDGTLWNLLTAPECNVKFYCLDFGVFGLSDDLYIKMNSRGKGLTDYEIFKSQLEKYIDVNLGDKDLMYEFAKKFDTNYTDLVWSEQNGDRSLIDDSFVMLFRNLLGIRNFLRGNKKYLEDLGYLGDYLPPKVGENRKSIPSWYIEKDDILFIIDFLDVFHSIFPIAESDPEGRCANDIVWANVLYNSDKILGEASTPESFPRIRTFKTGVNLFRAACNGILNNAERIMFYSQYYLLKKHPVAELIADKEAWSRNMNNLRHVRNLVESSDDELSRPNFICTMLSEVETILDGNISSLDKSAFNTIQFHEEKSKDANPSRWSELYFYENHDILRGSLSLLAPEITDKPFAIDEDPVFETLKIRLRKIAYIFSEGLKTDDHRIRAILLSYGDFGQISRGDSNNRRACYMYGRMPASWRLLLTKNSIFNQSRMLSVLDSIDENADMNIQDVSVDNWRYYATRTQWYEHTYWSYNMAKYGYYFFKNPAYPLEVYLLQSTSSYDDNVMWKLLNWLLQLTLAQRNIVPMEKSRLGDRQTAPELKIFDTFTIDVFQNGWKIGSEEFLDSIKTGLVSEGYVFNEADNYIEVPAGHDYVEYGVQLVTSINAILTEQATSTSEE